MHFPRSLVPLPRLQILSRLPTSKSHNEITLYVKGFLAEGETPQNFNDWSTSHHLLALSPKHSWDGLSVGYSWSSGAFPHPATIPVPLVTTLSAIAHFSRFARLSPVGLMSSIALDSTLNVAKLAYQYYQATQNADSKAEILAKNIAILRGWNPNPSPNNDHGSYRGQKSLDKKRKSHSKPGESLDKPRSFVYDKIRVVSHSLGCRHLLSALSILMSSEFSNSQTTENSSTLNYLPTSIHLCAAALTESDALPTLTKLCRHNVNVYIYFTEKDTVLSTMFRVMAKGEKAIGEVGLSDETVKYLQTLQTDSTARSPKLEGDFKNKKRKIKLVEVTGYFDRAIDKVHTGYANRFHRFAASDSYHIDHSHVQI